MSKLESSREGHNLRCISVASRQALNTSKLVFLQAS